MIAEYRFEVTRPTMIYMGDDLWQYIKDGQDCPTLRLAWSGVLLKWEYPGCYTTEDGVFVNVMVPRSDGSWFVHGEGSLKRYANGNLMGGGTWQEYDAPDGTRLRVHILKPDEIPWWSIVREAVRAVGSGNE